MMALALCQLEYLHIDVNLAGLQYWHIQSVDFGKAGSNLGSVLRKVTDSPVTMKANAISLLGASYSW